MEHKTYELGHFKALGDEALGEFEAIVSVFGNVDSYGDRVVKGAFAGSLERWRQKGRPIPVVFSHQWDNLDAHIGQVLEAEERDQGLYVRAQLEMDEPFAARVFKKLKNGTLSEFSFAYDVLQSERVDGVNELRELELFEVGPTLVGANRETQLLAVKAALGSHTTATTDVGWDGPANEARVRTDEGPAYFRRIYAWQDPDGDPALKTTYRFIHHMVDAGGDPGAANVRACSTGIGVLNGGRGGTTIPDADRGGVYNHLARHLRDADMEPPELKAMSVSGSEEDEGATEDEAGSTGKSSGPHPSVIAARVAIELSTEGMEE